MKRKLLIAATAFTLAVGLQSTASAAIQLQEGTAAGSIINGDKTFSNFFCHLNTLNPFATPVTCADISVIPFTDVFGNLGIQYGGSFSASAVDGVGIVDVRLTYDVTAPGATIVDVHMHFDANFAPVGTTAVLLPGAFYFLRETRLPPIEQLRSHKVPIAIASDCNPGTSPLTSLLLVMNMAATLFRLTVDECLIGVTRAAARALWLSDRGTLEVDKRCDLAIWNVEHPAELVFHLGLNPLHARVWQEGAPDDA